MHVYVLTGLNVFDYPTGVGPVVCLRDSRATFSALTEIPLWKVKEGSREPMRMSPSHDETLPHTHFA